MPTLFRPSWMRSGLGRIVGGGAGGGGGGAQVIFQDLFEGEVTGTLVTAHTPDVDINGGGWIAGWGTYTNASKLNSSGYLYPGGTDWLRDCACKFNHGDISKFRITTNYTITGSQNGDTLKLPFFGDGTDLLANSWFARWFRNGKLLMIMEGNTTRDSLAFVTENATHNMVADIDKNAGTISITLTTDAPESGSVNWDAGGALTTWGNYGGILPEWVNHSQLTVLDYKLETV